MAAARSVTKSVPPKDTTRLWADWYRVRGLLKPSLMLRMATDSNYLFNGRTGGSQPMFDTYNRNVPARVLMNCGMPGMRIPGLLNWEVTESIDTPTHTARAEFLNALPISVTSAVLNQDMEQRYFSNRITSQYVTNSLGVPTNLTYSEGNYIWDIKYLIDGSAGYTHYWNDDQVLFRTVASEYCCLDAEYPDWPDPRVPTDENDNSTYWPINAQGAGSYFILVGREVMRVHTWNDDRNILYVPPGGRGVNGIIEAHKGKNYNSDGTIKPLAQRGNGDTIYLLGFPPYTGKWAGLGYLSADDSKPYKSLLRPGTCFTSYEGYGPMPVGLDKTGWSPTSPKSYEFTGYWFVKGQETTLGPDGVPKTSVDLMSSGYTMTHQKITQNGIYRFKNQVGNWVKTTFDDIGHKRHIPGDWMDYHSWDPTLPGSTENGLQIKTEFAQHKAFFDHMQSSDFGRECEMCQTEYTEYVSRPGYKLHSNTIGENKPVGKHIYKESIRVYKGGHGHFSAGPIKTFGRLMSALAVVSWEIPMIGNPLGQRWTKMPNELFDNLRNWQTGRVWNGQLTPHKPKSTSGWDWSQAAHADIVVPDHPLATTGDGKHSGLNQKYSRKKLTCPFEANYDNQDWYQPILDLADVNQMTFMLSRRGYPILIPRGMKLRGRSGKDSKYYSHLNQYANGEGTHADGEWHMSWNGSISNYTQSLDVEQVLTMVTVNATTAFDSTISLQASGTTYDPVTHSLAIHPPAVGNSEGMRLTAGVQKVDTLSLDHLTLGLDWDTEPAGWGLTLKRDGQFTTVDGKPPYPDGTPALDKDYQGKKKVDKQIDPKKQVMNLQKTINWTIIHAYVNYGFEVPGSKKNTYLINEDGKFGNETEQGVKEIQKMLKNQGYYSGAISGIWNKTTSRAFKNWLTKHTEAIKYDPWWYVMTGYDWDYYVATITGLPIPQYEDTEAKGKNKFVIDQVALRQEVANWQEKYYWDMINLGNKVVDTSIAKAFLRSLACDIADPRIQLGDVIWLDIPGFLSSADVMGNTYGPFDHGMYVTNISRTMDLQAGTYKATYAGYKYQGGNYTEEFETDIDHFYHD